MTFLATASGLTIERVRSTAICGHSGGYAGNKPMIIAAHEPASTAARGAVCVADAPSSPSRRAPPKPGRRTGTCQPGTTAPRAAGPASEHSHRPRHHQRQPWPVGHDDEEYEHRDEPRQHGLGELGDAELGDAGRHVQIETYRRVAEPDLHVDI